MLDKFCELYGIEVDKQWETKDGDIYMIDSYGALLLQVKDEETPYWQISNLEFPDLIIGSLKPIWKPRTKDIYYAVDLSIEDGYFSGIFYEYDFEEELYELGLMFETEEEVIKVVEKLRNILKESHDYEI